MQYKYYFLEVEKNKFKIISVELRIENKVKWKRVFF